MSSFGQRLKFLREERGDNQEKIAKMLGISRAAISKYENNEREPDMKTILSLTNYFEVTVDYMFGKTVLRGHPHYIPENIKLIMANKSVEQIQSEIKSSTGIDLKLEELNDYLSGNKIPTIKTLIAFADYAHVNLDFFYKKNNRDSLKKEQENGRNFDRYATQEIVDEIIMNRSFIKLAVWIKERNLSPEKIISLLDNVLSIKKD